MHRKPLPRVIKNVRRNSRENGFPLNIESAIGKYIVTAAKDPECVTIAADRLSILESILDAIELMAGAEGEDNSFSLSDIQETQLFGRPQFKATITRAQLTRYFQYEILNFLEYKSLTEMRRQQKTTQLN
jgi:hypothetical protein